MISESTPKQVRSMDKKGWAIRNEEKSKKKLALESKKKDKNITGHSSALQLKRESIPHLEKMAKAEGKHPLGSYEERFKKFSKWHSNK
jgi:hypothetical protein